MKRGVTVRLKSEEPCHPLVFWANMTTGMSPERHGVHSPTVAQPRGLSGALYVDRSMVGFFEVLDVVMPLLRLSRETPLSASHVREKSLAEILAEHLSP